MIGERYRAFLEDTLAEAHRWGPRHEGFLRRLELGTQRWLLDEAAVREAVATREGRACHELLRPVWQQGLLGHEITHWPSGPGSARAMELIYENDPLRYDLRTHYTEWLLLTRDLAHAVRSRRDLLRELLVAELNGRPGPVRVLDLAAGPCQSLREALPRIEDPRRVALRAIDTDELAQAGSRAFFQREHGLPWDFEVENALRADLGTAEYDVLYSTGLFDYLATSTLVELWGRLYRAAKPGATLILAVKDGTAFCPLFYRWAVPWSQFHIRPEADFAEARARAGLPEPESVLRDATGCVVLYVIRKEA